MTGGPRRSGGVDSLKPPEPITQRLDTQGKVVLDADREVATTHPKPEEFT
jgi:hypothetical protein